MSVDLLLPAELPFFSVVAYRGPQPDHQALSDAVRRWVLERVPGPRRQALLEGLPRVSVGDGSEALPLMREMFGVFAPGVEEAAVLRQADRLLTVEVDATPATVDASLALETAVARALAHELGGVVVDGHRRAPWPLDSRLEAPPERVPPEELLVVLSAESEDGLWGVTQGLARYGLPELEVVGAPVTLLPHLATSLEQVAAALVREAHGAHGRRVHLSGLRVGEVRIGLSTTDEGRLRVHAPGDGRGDPGAALLAIARQTGEVPEEQELYVDRDDPEIVEATAEARRGLHDLRRRFRDGLGALVRLYVCASLEGEMVWLCVDRFTRTRVSGRVAQSSALGPQGYGERVTIGLDRVVDWWIAYPDGRDEGRYLDQVLARQGRLAGRATSEV